MSQSTVADIAQLARIAHTVHLWIFSDRQAIHLDLHKKVQRIADKQPFHSTSSSCIT
jgi:hypothetical protein